MNEKTQRKLQDFARDLSASDLRNLSCDSQDTKNSQNSQDLRDKNRWEFLADSARLAGITALATALPLVAKDTKDTAQTNQTNSQNPQNLQKSQNPQNKGDTMKNQQTWYITGASGGLGFALAKYLLSKGDKVALTSRKKGNLEAKFGELAKSENFLALTLTFDKNIDKQVAQNIAEVKRVFGRLDNVVNNAGYGLGGFVEEVSEKQLREQFEVNVFAPFLVAQNALKIMRPQAKSEGGSAQNIKARIYNLSSIAGFRVPNGSTPYSMSKFALSALSEGLMLDLADFGIAVVNVMPAGFRTEFLGTSYKMSDIQIADYDKKREVAIANVSAYNGKQAGNPQAFAKVIYETSRMPKPPFSLFMSDNAYKSARNKIAWVQEDMKATEKYAGAAVDFADSAGSAFDKR